MIYKHTILGGTFDRLHKGHVTHLQKSFQNTKRVTIGLTTQEMIQKKRLSQLIEPYEIREANLLKKIKERWQNLLVKIVPISDVFGPSISDPTIDRIVVTKATLPNGKKVNEERKKKKLPLLQIDVAETVLADDSLELSSSRIRAGEIDREGFVYARLFDKTIHLPDSLRDELRKPLGEVIQGTEVLSKAAKQAIQFIKKQNPLITIAVGDIVSDSLQKGGLIPDLSVIDYRSQRKNLTNVKDVQFDVKNQPGVIDFNAVNLIKKYINENKKQLIRVEGEEDLLVLPVGLLAPLNAAIAYGQKDLGVIVMTVTEELKMKLRKIVERFA